MYARRTSSGDATAHGDEHGGTNAAERCGTALLDGVSPGEEPTDRAVGISQEKQQAKRDSASCAFRLQGGPIAPTESDGRGNMRSVQRKLEKGPSEGTTRIRQRHSRSLSALALDLVGDGSHAFHSNRLLRLYGCGPDSRRQEKQKNQKKGFSVDDWGSSSLAELPYGMYFPNELWVVRYVTGLAREVLDELQEHDISSDTLAMPCRHAGSLLRTECGRSVPGLQVGESLDAHSPSGFVLTQYNDDARGDHVTGSGDLTPGESAQKYVTAQEDAMLVPVPPWMRQVCRCAGGKGVRVFWVPDEEFPRCFECVKPVRSATKLSVGSAVSNLSSPQGQVMRKK